MKNLLLIFALGFSCISAFNQDVCKDKIYPVDSEIFIRNCCIYKISYGNKVYYIKGGDSAMVKAASIFKGGRKIFIDKYKSYDLINSGKNIGPAGNYQGHNYEYYLKKYRKATIKRNVGVSLTIGGFAFSVGVFLFTGHDIMSSGGTIASFSVIVMLIGIPIWIKGGVKRRNNDRVMTGMEGVNISLGTSRDGIGLKFNL